MNPEHYKVQTMIPWSFWSSYCWTHKHSNVQNVLPEFKAKIAKYQDTWQKAIGHDLPTTW